MLFLTALMFYMAAIRLGPDLRAIRAWNHRRKRLKKRFLRGLHSRQEPLGLPAAGATSEISPGPRPEVAPDEKGPCQSH